MKQFRLALLLCLATAISSCDSFLDIRPTGKVIAETGEEYRALLTSEYKNFPEDRGLVSFRSDEMTLDESATTSEDLSSFFDIWVWNDLKPAPTTVSLGWRRYYHTIYIANTIIANRDNMTQISTADRRQLVGEAYMMRAYCHFLLANLYAQPYTTVKADTARAVPLMLVADVNLVPKSKSLAAVYEQVERDVDSAAVLMNKETWPIGFNYRFNTTSAKALKARIALYKGDWTGALAAAQQVITAHPALEDLTSSSAKLPTSYQSEENIVALEQVMTPTYTRAGRVSNELLALYKSGDRRKTHYFNEVSSTTTLLRKGGGRPTQYFPHGRVLSYRRRVCRRVRKPYRGTNLSQNTDGETLHRGVLQTSRCGCRHPVASRFAELHLRRTCTRIGLRRTPLVRPAPHHTPAVAENLQRPNLHASAKRQSLHPAIPHRGG